MSEAGKLFIGGLAWETTEASLREAFGKYGRIEEAKVINDHETGRSRGFGFVTFSEPSEADAALREMNDQELDGRPIRVDHASDRGGRGGGGGGRGGGRDSGRDSYGGGRGGRGGSRGGGSYRGGGSDRYGSSDRYSSGGGRSSDRSSYSDRSSGGDRYGGGSSGGSRGGPYDRPSSSSDRY
mmetsp:Transcript_1368/g.2412  ORF Transcript_1368/g.2412 Transcript_1368/m.2412 type:complete len:182 (+) Transcript_1368:77-622(+)